MTDEEEPAEYGLVMPFVAVTSKGGIYDDDAYTAGWEMGQLYTRLERRGDAVLRVTIHSANAEQADLVAMRHGYRCDVERSEECPDWTFATFTRGEAPPA